MPDTALNQEAVIAHFEEALHARRDHVTITHADLSAAWPGRRSLQLHLELATLVVPALEAFRATEVLLNSAAQSHRPARFSFTG